MTWQINRYSNVAADIYNHILLYHHHHQHREPIAQVCHSLCLAHIPPMKTSQQVSQSILKSTTPPPLYSFTGFKLRLLGRITVQNHLTQIIFWCDGEV
jgi:hypothetical protein